MKEIIQQILSDKEISKLVFIKTLPKDEIVFDEGDESTSIFLIEEGSVVIEKAINKEKTEFKELAYISAPSFIGEIALFENLKRTARARTLSECKMIEINQENFKEILRIKPDIAGKILFFISKTLALRLAHTSKELTLLYDISKQLTERYTEEKEFLKKLSEEISIYFSECEIETYYYNFFNDEFEKVWELSPYKNPDIDLKNYRNSQWIDNTNYIAVISDDKQTKAVIVYSFERELSNHEINDYTTIFNTISYIALAGIKEASRNKEVMLMEKLKKRKGSI